MSTLRVGFRGRGGRPTSAPAAVGWFGVGLACVGLVWGAGWARAQRPSTHGHVPELASYLDRLQIAEPVRYRHLAIYPLLLERGPELGGRWMGVDRAVAEGILVIYELPTSPRVPRVVVENRSRAEHVLILSGEVLAGGKQSRTVRQDVIVAPRQRVELDVFCVERHRWSGGQKFQPGKVLVPQSLQWEIRQGASQERVWEEIAHSTAALGAPSPTESLEEALNSAAVRATLGEVRGAIVPQLPPGTVGFIAVGGRRALGAELLGSAPLARELMPKLLDSYAVDCVILGKGIIWPAPPPDHRPAIEFIERLCRAGSHRTETPGSGAGIRTRGAGLVGDGVSLGGTLVHFGVQAERIIPLPAPHRPPIRPQ